MDNFFITLSVLWYMKEKGTPASKPVEMKIAKNEPLKPGHYRQGLLLDGCSCNVTGENAYISFIRFKGKVITMAFTLLSESEKTSLCIKS